MQNYIENKHGNVKRFILNLLLLGIAGAIVINLANVAFYALMPTSYFIKHNSDNTVTAVCRTGQNENIYALQTTISREIYPYLPDSISKNRSIPANGRVEVLRNGREIDRINTEFIYQWELDDTSEIQNEINIILLPGTYSTRSYINLDLPYRSSREAIRVDSNTFTVPDEVPLCSRL